MADDAPGPKPQVQAVEGQIRGLAALLHAKNPVRIAALVVVALSALIASSFYDAIPLLGKYRWVLYALDALAFAVGVFFAMRDEVRERPAEKLDPSSSIKGLQSFTRADEEVFRG